MDCNRSVGARWREKKKRERMAQAEGSNYVLTTMSVSRKVDARNNPRDPRLAEDGIARVRERRGGGMRRAGVPRRG
jgi:hypothetical protein